MRAENTWNSRYVLAVCAAGLSLAAIEVASHWSALIRRLTEQPGPEFWLLMVFVFLGSLIPIRISREEDQEELSTSTTFAFALLILWGTTAAVLATSLASLLADVRGRRRPRKIAFNIAQTALATIAAGHIYSLWTMPGAAVQPLLDRYTTLFVFVAAAATFFVVSNAINGIALALAQRYPVLEYLRRDLPFQLSSTGLLLAMAPVVMVVSEHALALLPLLTIPTFAVYRSGKASIEKEHQAMHDALTGLPNRTLLRDRLEQAVLGAARDHAGVAVMLIDLDRFKEVNDTLGHHIGDLLLKQVAVRLQGCLRKSDTVARLGGDEFAVVVPHLEGPTGAEDVAHKALAALAEPFDLPGMQFSVEASIGIATYPRHGSDAEALLRRADIAMYTAKESHTGFEHYTVERDRHNRRRLGLLGELKQAMADGQLTVHYQPQVDTRSGVVSGVEALVRWEHPEHGLIPPGDFLPLTESSGLIRPLTYLVLDETLRQSSEWRRAGVDLTVAVNASVWNIYDPTLPDQIEELLQRWNVPPERLTIEITESLVIADPARAITVLERLRRLGIKLSLDDFGTGYSSLAYLNRMPVHEIKIDKSFVAHMLQDEGDELMVRSIVDLGHNMNFEIVAEGAEDDLTIAKLSAMGCEYVQGFGIGRPLTAKELWGWLSSSRWGPVASTRNLVLATG